MEVATLGKFDMKYIMTKKKGPLLTTKVPTILLKEYRSNGSGVLGKDNYRCSYSYHYIIHNVEIIKGYLGNLFKL